MHLDNLGPLDRRGIVSVNATPLARQVGGITLRRLPVLMDETSRASLVLHPLRGRVRDGFGTIGLKIGLASAQFGSHQSQPAEQKHRESSGLRHSGHNELAGMGARYASTR